MRFKCYEHFYLRNRSAPAVNCWVIIHCLEVSCLENQITSAQREWFIFVQLTKKQRIITRQFTHWSLSILILTHNKRRKHIRSLQLLPTFRHCTEELPPILRLRRIRLHVIVNVTSFNLKNDVTPSNAMNDVIFQWRQLSTLELWIIVRYITVCYRWLFRRGVLELLVTNGWTGGRTHIVIIVQTQGSCNISWSSIIIQRTCHVITQSLI